MKRFLSIDWDYYVDATDFQRYTMFPDGGNENLPASLRDYIWDTYYANPELEKLGVLPIEFKYLLHYCRQFKGKALVADSHKHIFNFIMENTDPDEYFEVYNIDFHHDLYDFQTSGGERVNCGNWATELRKERPKMSYKWIHRKDSDCYQNDEVVDAELMTFSAFSVEFLRGIADDFDYLFLCRSSVWSPPHLDKKFVRAVKALMSQNCICQYEVGIDKPRKYEKSFGFDDPRAMSILAEEARKHP